MKWSDTLFILPEIVLTVGGSVLLLAPVVGRKRGGESAKWWMLVVLLLTALSTVYAAGAVQGVVQTESFLRMFALDGFALFFKLLFIVILAAVTMLSVDFLREENYSPWEYYSLLTFALAGMTFMASGVHMITIYVGLELLSLSSYILAGYYKNETKSTEAAMKYLILGAASSGILLYGMSLIYGVCGSLQLDRIAAKLATLGSNDALIIGVTMLAAGLCFKIAAVPFHVWTPDVYEGAPTPVTAFLSTASKAAAFAIFARIFYTALPSFRVDWSMALAVIAALSMIVGNFAAITQNNVKRMLAYSSIAHAGYVLMGILAMNDLGLWGILVYSFVYAFANLGIWATVLMLRRHAYAGESISDFEGLHRRAPLWSFAMIIFLLSLGGIPPTAGFIGKYFLFAAAVKSGYGWLAIIAVLTSAVSMFYYLRIVVAMYLKEGVEAEIAPTASLTATALVCFVLTLAIGVVPERLLIRNVQESARTVLTSVVQPPR
jgi:NADH-quinone oxidoreductase subunit N